MLKISVLIYKIKKIEARVPYITLMGTFKNNLKINQINLLSSFKKEIPGIAINQSQIYLGIIPAFKIITLLGRYTKPNKSSKQFRFSYIS